MKINGSSLLLRNYFPSRSSFLFLVPCFPSDLILIFHTRFFLSHPSFSHAPHDALFFHSFFLFSSPHFHVCSRVVRFQGRATLAHHPRVNQTQNAFNSSLTPTSQTFLGLPMADVLLPGFVHRYGTKLANMYTF